jgi:diacylglycerol kinase family enzyme
MLALVNPHAGGGKGRTRWEHVRGPVAALVGTLTTVLPAGAAEARDAVRRALLAGERDFIAAGGDGTVNLVVDALLTHVTVAERRRLRLAAVGLGSSNDFHKPHRPDGWIGKVPVRLRFDRTVAHDVGLLRYQVPDGAMRCRRFILNASIGVTAEGNRRFNDDPAVARAKRVHPDLGMTWAALAALFDGGPWPMHIATDGAPPVIRRVTNLGVVKSPHFTGMLRYDSAYEPGNGEFDVHLLGDVTRPARVRAIAALCFGRFTGRPGTSSWRARRLSVSADQPFAVEGDGEIVMTTHAEFSLDPRALAVCT